jgi:NagD protein
MGFQVPERAIWTSAMAATDVLCGLAAGLETILVLTGICTREDAERFPYRPDRIVDSVADLVDEI